MWLRIDRRRLHVLYLVLATTLLLGGIGAVRSGNHALESVLVACRQMLFVFGEHLSFGTATAIALLALLVSGLALMSFGGIRDILQLYTLEKRARKGAVILSHNPKTLLTSGIPHQAWTSGFLKPRIYIARESYESLSEGERKALLAHEKAHVVHHDVLKRAIANALRRLFWFVPTVADVTEIIRFGQEVRADSVAMAAAGRHALCSLYLSSAGEKAPAHASSFAFASPRLAEVLDGVSTKARLSTSRLAISFFMTSLVSFGGWNGFVNEVSAEAPSTCALIETMAPQSFTPLVGPLELYTPNPENTCSENLSC